MHLTRQRATTYCIVGFVVFAIVGGIISTQEVIMSPKAASDTTASKEIAQAKSVLATAVTPTITAIPTPQFTPTPTKPLRLEDRIRASLKLGDDTKLTDVYLQPDQDPTTQQDIPGKVAVMIDYHMNGTYLDTEWMKRGSWSIDTEIIKDVFPLDQSINTVIMIAEAPVTNAYGKDDYDTLTSVTIGRDTYSQINFAKFDTKNLPVIADRNMENKTIK